MGWPANWPRVRLNWTTRKERTSVKPTKFPEPEPVKIRRIGPRGFYHEGKVVKEGQVITCDHDIAATLVAMQKAEYVDPRSD